MSGDAPEAHAAHKCPHKRRECDGKMTLGPDPFSEEIYNDSSDQWQCAGERYESAMDI